MSKIVGRRKHKFAHRTKYVCSRCEESMRKKDAIIFEIKDVDGKYMLCKRCCKKFGGRVAIMELFRAPKEVVYD